MLIACLAGCQDERNGAYVVLDGAEVAAFDRVTFYFGKGGERAPIVLPAPRFAVATGERQYAFERTLVPSDAQPAAASTFTYYLTDASQGLGEYMIAIAYAGDVPVGITELIDFEIPSDVALIYELALVPYLDSEVQRWGRFPRDDDECVRWTRFRDGDDPVTGPSTVVVGRKNDRDCDGFDDAATDCDPHAYCDPLDATSSCSSGACLIDGDGTGPACQLGACTNQDGQAPACAPVACLVEAACTTCPVDGRSPAERVACAVRANETHVDFDILTNGDGTLCANPYTFALVLPGQIACVDPEIVLTMSDRDELPLQFSFHAFEDEATGMCKIVVTELVDGARFTDAVPHLVITFGSPGPDGSRPSFVVGLTVQSGACDGLSGLLASPLGFCER